MVCPHQLPININGVINPNISYETPSFKVVVMVEKKLFFIFDIYAKNLNFLTHVFLAPYRAMHSYDILGARMLWKPKEARILKNFIDQPV